MMRSGGFSPASLFAGGAEGAWFDPSDLTTLFQDSAGTTPVTAAGQPVGRMLDKSQGLVLGPELIGGDADWTLNAASTVSGGVLSTTIATAGEIASQNTPIVAGNFYKVQYRVLSTNGQAIVPRLSGNAGSSAPATTTTGNFSAIIFALSDTDKFAFNVAGSGVTATIDNISVRLLPGNHATQATASKRPTYQTGAGLSWLAFDGVDDSMATAEIDFTGTDKVSVFAGVLRIDATARIIAELSVNAGSTSGAFYFVSGTDAGFTAYSSFSRGTINPIASGIAGFSSAINPSTDVLSITHDIAGDLSTMRVNQVEGTSGTGDKGAGNFGNYPLYIGARNQTSVYFKGNVHGLIIPGKLASAPEIAATEAYLAAKSGVTL
jgi:hypothetical protein